MTEATQQFSVVFFSSIDWDFRKQDQQIITLALADSGHDIVYVENTGARMPGLRDLARVRHRIARLLHSAAPIDSHPGVEVVTPLVIPGGSSWIERRINQWLLRRSLRPHQTVSKKCPLVLWVSLPTWSAVDVIDILKPDVIVYYCGDVFSRIPGVRSGIEASERLMLQRADLVFATSQALADRCATMGVPAILVPVVVDIEASSAARRGDTARPADLADLPGRLIGYMGGLNHKVDRALLDRVAAEFASDTLVILGSVEDPAFRPSPARNVVILGERTYAEISAYLARFDVCLIPYLVNDFTAGVYPAKLLEYLAVGRPVVSTPLPEVLPFLPLVRVAADHDAFVRSIREALAEPGDDRDREARIQAVVARSRSATASMLAELDRTVQRVTATQRG